MLTTISSTHVNLLTLTQSPKLELRPKLPRPVYNKASLIIFIYLSSSAFKLNLGISTWQKKKKACLKSGCICTMKHTALWMKLPWLLKALKLKTPERIPQQHHTWRTGLAYVLSQLSLCGGENIETDKQHKELAEYEFFKCRRWSFNFLAEWLPVNWPHLWCLYQNNCRLDQPSIFLDCKKITGGISLMRWEETHIGIHWRLVLHAICPTIFH